MTPRFVAAGILLTVVGGAVPAEAAQLIKNGDFTQLSNGVGQLNTNTSAAYWYTSGPDPTGYSFVMNNGDAGGPGEYGNVALWTQTTAGNGWNGTTLSGNGNFLAMDGDFQSAAVSQTVNNLIPGDSYYITFNTAFSQQTNWYGATNQDVTVSFGSFGEQLWLANFGSTYSLPSQGFSGWTQ